MVVQLLGHTSLAPHHQNDSRWLPSAQITIQTAGQDSIAPKIRPADPRLDSASPAILFTTNPSYDVSMLNLLVYPGKAHACSTRTPSRPLCYRKEATLVVTSPTWDDSSMLTPECEQLIGLSSARY